jgi:hypothetical protein
MRGRVLNILVPSPSHRPFVPPSHRPTISGMMDHAQSPRYNNYVGPQVVGHQYSGQSHSSSHVGFQQNASGSYQHNFMPQQELQFTVPIYSHYQFQQPIPTPIDSPTFFYVPQVINGRVEYTLQASASYQTYGRHSVGVSNIGLDTSFVDRKPSTAPAPVGLPPRAPPRRPKQSGFALWVGNLPRDVRLQQLADFFAMDGIESICLIHKSHCAFINYKTEEISVNALSLFNHKGKALPFLLM